MTQVDEQIVSTQDHIDHLHSAKARAESEQAEQAAAVADARYKLEEVVAAHRDYHRSDGPTADELAFQTAAVADTNNNVLFTLGQLAREFPELQPTLQAELQARGLVMPARPPSRAPTSM